MRKEWWYVIVLTVLVLLVMIVFRNEINFSPDKSSGLEDSGAGEDSGFDAFISQFSGEEDAQAAKITEQLKEIATENKGGNE